jgi:hypothetical protein
MGREGNIKGNERRKIKIKEEVNKIENPKKNI